MTTMAGLNQRARDRDAAEATPEVNAFEQRHTIFTTVPLYTNTASDNWRQDVQGWLTPIDLEGRALFLNSIRVWVQAQQAQTDDLYIGIYEAMPSQLGINPSPTYGKVQVRRVGFSFKTTLEGGADDDTNFVVIKTVPTDLWLLPDKQYFVYIYANSSRIRLLCPSFTRTSYAVQGDGPSAVGIVPQMLELRRIDDLSQRPSPLVELRSRYGAAIFGDTSQE